MFRRDGVAHHHVGQLLGAWSSLVSTVPIYWPLRSTATRSEMAMTSLSLWVMMMIALPSARMLPQHVEELLRLLGGQHGGGLVQDQDIRAPVEDLDDLHRLLLGDGHVVDLLVRVNIEAVPARLMSRIAGHDGFPVELALAPSGPARCSLAAREHIDQLEVLVDHADAQGEWSPWGSGW